MKELLELKEYLEITLNRLKIIIESSYIEDDKLFMNYINGKKDATHHILENVNLYIKYQKNE
jgi:hypothetical protein